MRELNGSLLLTLRELWAKRITQGVIVITTIAWVLLSFAMNLDIVEGSISAIRIFGLESEPMRGVRDPESGDLIRQALSLDQFVLGINQFIFGASYLFGTLLGLFATMPLIGGFLEEGRIELFISKPLSRHRLLAGHVLGVWLTVFILASYLILGIWLVLSVKTGVWEPLFLISIPIITVMFGVMYSVVMTLTIMIRSSGLPLVAAYGLIFFSLVFAAHEQILPVLAPSAAVVFRAFYHTLPNFIEVMPLISQLVRPETVPDWYPLWSSLLFGAVMYATGFVWFARRDF